MGTVLSAAPETRLRRRRCVTPLLLLVCVALGTSWGCSRADRAHAATPLDAEKEPPKLLSEAERIAQAERLLEEAKKDLADTDAELADPASDYAKAETEFKQLDAQVEAQKKAIAKFRTANQPDEVAKAEEKLKALTAEWQKARDRFNLLIAKRKTIQAKRTALTAQIEKSQQTLAALRGTAVQPPKKDSGATPVTKADPPPVPKVPPATVPGIPGTVAPATSTTPAPARVVKDDDEIRRARAAAEARRATLAEVQEKADSVEERIRVLEELIATEEKLLGKERWGADETEQELARLVAQLSATPPADQAAALAKVQDTRQRFEAARGRIVKLTERIAALNNDLHAIQSERIEALQALADTNKAADAADRELSELQNPLSTRNVNKWLASHGINMILIAVGIVALHALTRMSSRQIVRLVARNSHRGSEEDRENRASTLVGVFRYATALIIFGGGIVMLLDEAGVPIVPLMGGAAVMGLAVAFGAQNLIKDYFTGFMMLLEDQYGVNDVVRIGSISGLVEKITLRVTVLRDLEGVLHFVPHGQVTAVSNMTHGWSRALFDIPVPHTADLTLVMDEVMRLARELRADPAFAPKIIEDPEMLGIEVLDGAASVVRFLVKTRPLQQWAVKRELLRRIRLRLTELGLDPAPTQVLQLKLPDGSDPRDVRNGRPPDWRTMS